MRIEATTLRWASILLGFLLITAALSACSGELPPLELTTKPISTPAGDTATPAPAPGTSRMSLDEYVAAMCTEEEGEEEEGEGEFPDMTYREYSADLELFIAALEAINPPPEVAEYHNGTVAYIRDLKAAVDDYGGSKDDVITSEGIAALVFSWAGLGNFQATGEAISAMAPEVRERMIAAGCIDENFAGGFAGGGDETELVVGERVEAALDNPGEWDKYFFQAEQGELYLIEVASGTLPELSVLLPDGLQIGIEFEPGDQERSLYWEAESAGTAYLTVLGDSGNSTGAYTISVSLDPRPGKPANVQYEIEGSVVRISWDAVSDAEYYTIYSDDLGYCGVSPFDGAVVGCEELDANLVEPTYLHTNPSAGNKYYWVVACNSHGCSWIDDDNSATPIVPIPSGPENVRFAHEGSAIRVNWDPVDGADHYNVYHDDFFDSSCYLDRDGPGPCEELAPNVTETTYIHTTPSGGSNYYWVVACNRGGCSEIDSANPASPIEPIPTGPENVRFAHEGSAIRVSWDPVDGADHYNVYHDDFRDSGCTLNRDGSPRLCDELATNVTEATYLHTAPSGGSYWVVACNRGGCSEIDSANPATPIEAIPSGPTNVRYAGEGSAIRVSWDPVDGADHYNVYHDDFRDSRCTLNRDGSPSLCDELATNVTETTYLHASPSDRNNYYWVAACNRGGCSEIDSENPAIPMETGSTRPSGAATPTPAPTPRQPATPADTPTPAGYTEVTLSSRGRVWGLPSKYTIDSETGAVAYMLLGMIKGCAFADAALQRGDSVFIKTEELGRLSNYSSTTVCQKRSSTWESSWNGRRITHMRYFDDDAPTKVSEYVADSEGGQDNGSSVPQPVSTPTPTQPATPTATPTPAPTPTQPATSTATPTPAPTPTQPATPTATPTPAPTPTPASTCAPRDRDALVAIYHAMGGTDWQQDQNWLSEEPVGAWYGVTTDDDGCVTRLELSRNELSGEIPSELGSISRLRVLNLSDNNRLTGEIPAELGNLSLLEHLDLSDQTGQTDRSYALSGEIPEELGNLTNLKSLKLSWHALGGELPPQLGNLGHLESLNVHSNNLSGEIPSELGSLRRLRSLILGWNDLSGEIPSELGSIAALEWLDLSRNNLGGQIPPDLSSLTNLETLDLRDNNLSGRIPPELGSLSSLTTLRLDNNSLEDGIPPELSGLSNLNTLNLSDNQLSGEILGTLGGMRELATLDLSDNNLSGSIPEEFGGLSKLESLYLRENSLSGSIPVELAQLPALRKLFVAGNEFTGCIPPELRALGRNRTWDPVRSWLGFSLPRDNTDLHKLGLSYCSVPPNQQYASEGSAIRVSWDPVERADYYTVYHDDFFSSSCTLDIDDNPLFCEELATNVVGTTYLHADPSDGDNYYWVVACGGDECSDISSRNPATRVGTESTGPASTDTDAPAETGVSGTANVRYVHEGSAIRVSWDPVDGADHYNVYHDDFRDSGCTLNRNGSPRLCDELATNVTEATYLHTAPSGGSNYYWVAACTSVGCSEIDSENPATPIEAIPSGPTNVRYAGEGSAIRVSWDPVRGADFYNIYHDDFQDSRCSLRRDGSPSFCDELATNISETTYLHGSPSDRNNYYWVVACNRGGCSEIDSENPAALAETDTTGQTDTTTESTTSGELEFPEGNRATRSIPENTPGGINVGDPVSADADGALTHTMSGPDGGSFAIIPATGQIRTRDGVVYDYETKNRYEVTVGASETDGGSASIDVVIHIENLVPACEPIRNRRTNHGDGYVRVKWNPALQRDGKAGVLGYEVEMRRRDDGPWSNRRTVPGRSIGSTIYEGLDNLASYWFQVRPVAIEGDCGWSPPFLGIPAPYLPPIYPGDRFGTDPVGTSDRNWRFLTNGRCRYTSGDVTADANCIFHITGPDTSKVVLEFDDPSLGSCDVVLAYSSLTAGSFIDECFDAGVNTEVPFDTSFRMPRSGPQTEADVPRSPRSQEEFDVFAWGRDDFIPGLLFGCPPAFSTCGLQTG